MMAFLTDTIYINIYRYLNLNLNFMFFAKANHTDDDRSSKQHIKDCYQYDYVSTT